MIAIFPYLELESTLALFPVPLVTVDHHLFVALPQVRLHTHLQLVKGVRLILLLGRNHLEKGSKSRFTTFRFQSEVRHSALSDFSMTISAFSMTVSVLKFCTLNIFVETVRKCGLSKPTLNFLMSAQKTQIW